MAPPTLAQHLEDFVTHTVPYAFQVDRYRAVKFVVGDFRHRTLGRFGMRALFNAASKCP